MPEGGPWERNDGLEQVAQDHRELVALAYALAALAAALGYITGHYGDFAAETGEVQPNGTVHFAVDLYDSPCKTLALGVSGYFSS